MTHSTKQQTKLELMLIDVCLPGYFTGFGAQVFAVPVHSQITMREVIDGLREEIDATTDGSDGIPYDQLIKDYRRDIIQMVGHSILDETAAFPQIPPEADNQADTVYAFYGVVGRKDDD